MPRPEPPRRPGPDSRYDQPFRGPRPGPGGPPPRGGGFGPERGYAHGGPAGGGDFRPHPGRGGGWVDRERGPGHGWTGVEEPEAMEAAWAQDEPVYGPARYGLGPYHQRLHTRRRPDAELKEEVQEALFYDTWVDAEAITVEVSDGIVTLTGELPDYEEVRYATDDAWDVDGVRGVRTQLTVRGDSPSQERGGR
jgi:hypothetical protein